jgi:hypothetical protein
MAFAWLRGVAVAAPGFELACRLEWTWSRISCAGLVSRPLTSFSFAAASFSLFKRAGVLPTYGHRGLCLAAAVAFVSFGSRSILARTTLMDDAVDVTEVFDVVRDSVPFGLIDVGA